MSQAQQIGWTRRVPWQCHCGNYNDSPYWCRSSVVAEPDNCGACGNHRSLAEGRQLEPGTMRSLARPPEPPRIDFTATYRVPRPTLLDHLAMLSWRERWSLLWRMWVFVSLVAIVAGVMVGLGWCALDWTLRR